MNHFWPVCHKGDCFFFDIQMRAKLNLVDNLDAVAMLQTHKDSHFPI